MSAPSVIIPLSFEEPVSLALSVTTFTLLFSLVGLVALELFVIAIPYGKFSKTDCDKHVPSKVGMLIIYVPACLLFPLATLFASYGLDGWVGPGVTNTPRHWVLYTVVTLHFVKRVLEVAFMHKFSGTVGLFTSAILSFTYLFLGGIQFLISIELAFLPPALNDWSALLYAGIAVNFVGEIGNLYHHYLFAAARQPGETAYKIPKGGLFWLFPTPHYVAEIISWFGIFLISGHIAGFLSVVLLSMIYLTGRTYNVLKWYKKKSDNGEFDEPLPVAWNRLMCFDKKEAGTVSA